MSNYDIIGDIHGQADKLEQLLEHLGYKFVEGVYQPGPDKSGQGDNKVVFLGDFIDRGMDNRRVLEIVRPMVETGHALAVMGNHEFNAVSYHTRHPETDRPLRPHSRKNQQQHQRFLDEYPLRGEETTDVLDWFRTLPLFLEVDTNAGVDVFEIDEDDDTPKRTQVNGRIRSVHACWDQAQVDYLMNRLGYPARIDDSFLIESSQKGTPACAAIETLLKGPEIPLPGGASFFDKDGHKRRNIRYKWWAGGRTFQDIAVVPSDQRSTIPNLPVADRYHAPSYSPDSPPVFFGHYWMNGDAQAQRHNVACLDYSAGKGGPLAAYRWFDDGRLLGAGRLRGDRFVTTDDLQNAPPDIYTFPEVTRRAAWDAAKDADQIRNSEKCGCFSCLSVFEPIELDPDDLWPDCPRCGTHYVIGSDSGLPLSRRFLTETKEFWLTPPFPVALDKE